MGIISIQIRNRVARVIGSPKIVCGNSDYTASFDFDSEWNAYAQKTVQFFYVRHGKPYVEMVEFTGESCYIPVLHDVELLEIGVTAGTIRTSTPARVPCFRCITDAQSIAYKPRHDVYNEIMDTIQAALNPPPKLPSGYVFVVSVEGDYITASDGSYMIARRES